jgi:hypothetical protein
MAQLKDTLVSGNLRVTDKLLVDSIQTTGSIVAGEMSVGSLPVALNLQIWANASGATSAQIDVPNGAKYLLIDVWNSATSVRSYHYAILSTSIVSTSLIQTATIGQYGLTLSIQPIQFVLSGAAAITGGVRYTITMSSGSVITLSGGATPSASSATPKFVTIYACR